jgi:Na+/melibiose symporter-like transporter
MSLKANLKKIYFNESPLHQKEFHSSRKLFIFEGCAAVGIFSLTSGAFLAGFAEYLGASDQFNGILAAIPALAGIIQVFSPIVFEKLINRKFLVSVLALFFRLVLGFMIFIPLLVQDKLLRLSLLAGMYFVANLAASFLTPAAGNWIISLTPESMRGNYFGRRDSYILAITSIIALVMGKVLDLFRQNNQTYTGFLLIAGVVIILTIINFYFLSSIKEPPVEIKDMKLDIKKVFTVPIRDKNFRKIILLFLLWNVGFQIGGPFFGVYIVTGLKLKYTYIMILGALSSLTSVLAVRSWGRLADRKSWVFTTKMSLGLLAISHSTWFFVNAKNVLLLIPLYLLGGVAWAGINLSLFNIQFKYAPIEGRTIYIGFNAAIGGLVGFLTALLGSFVVGALEGHKFSLLGISIGNMQLVFGLSGLLIAACVAFIHFKIKD